ncbi:MAG: translation initiation factor IF-2 subunit alpha [Candidatus Bathyarchaeia archaeon]
MNMRKSEWPRVGDLVVTTVRRIMGHGAYVYLDEYDREGLLHISEISSRWVRNIRNHVREGQKVVLQVLRVDPSRGHVDLSLRRVSKDERRKKMEEFKKNRKAETLLKSAAIAHQISEEEIYEKAGAKIVERYGSLYAGLEAAARDGVEALTVAGVPKRIAKTLTEIAREKIVVRGVTIQGVFELSSTDPRGVERIRETMLMAKEVGRENEVGVSIYTIGAPKYRVEVTAEDYRKAEAALEKMVTAVESSWSGQRRFSFARE